MKADRKMPHPTNNLNLQTMIQLPFMHLAPASSLRYVLAKYQFMLIMIITFTFSIVNCTKEKKGISQVKATLNLPYI